MSSKEKREQKNTFFWIQFKIACLNSGLPEKLEFNSLSFNKKVDGSAMGHFYANEEDGTFMNG